jgi:plastocyanin
MRRILVGLLVLVPLAALADGGQTVIQKGRRFHPDEITVDKGTSLTFENDDEFIHQIYATGLFDSDEKAPGETLTETFSRTGTFEVHCHIHPKMKLVVHVK